MKSMATSDFLVTVDFDRVSNETVDIGELVTAVPTARIVSGNPSISVHVVVDDKESERLFTAVRRYCIMDSYSDLDLF
jgi:hypothetical protein